MQINKNEKENENKKIKYYGAAEMINKANSIKNIEAYPYSDRMIQVIYTDGFNGNKIYMSTIECTDESLEDFLEYVIKSKTGTSA